MPKNSSPNDNPLKALAKASGMGIQMGVMIFGGHWLGQWLDQKMQWNFLETGLTMLMVALSIYQMIKQTKNI